MQERLHNINVLSSEILPTPEEIKRRLPLPPESEDFVYRSRGAVCRILDREDPRLFVVVGPCSIHDPAAAREYAERLQALSASVEDTSPTNQTLRNSQFLADGTLDQSRLQPQNAGFGAATQAQAMRTVRLTFRFSF